ncbi:FAD-binding oxidoreductase [Sorangium sp. So ce260]|uniref:FAD-binding oxidoreductase n=1 Tax=Sorangium sp. So ce260 TaxID=3133291 RepID=UPI003F62D47F
MRSPQQIHELFSAFAPRVISGPITHFGRLRQSADTFCEIAPASGAELADAIGTAHRHGVPVRIRGQGHALNGASLPAAHELLLRTERLGDVRFETEGTVTAGAGVVLWSLRSVVERHGYTVPVVNDGYAGPSVAGFVAAGGFGPRSNLHGGFWENVAALTLVDGTGRLKRIDRSEALFPWLFGAMGQLGVVVEATLDIVPLDTAPPDGASPPPYPAGAGASRELIAASPELQGSGPDEAERDERLLWFTLFTPGRSLARAQARLAALEAEHAGLLSYRQRYAYPIRQRRPVPALVYPRHEPFFAIGSWGALRLPPGDAAGPLRAHGEELTRIATELGCRRYVQSETTCDVDAYRACFGEETHEAFRGLKAQQDPGLILNRGSVFTP